MVVIAARWDRRAESSSERWRPRALFSQRREPRGDPNTRRVGIPHRARTPSRICRGSCRQGSFEFDQLSSADGRRSPSLAQASQRYLLKHMMIDALEKRLVEALKSVDAHGDVAPAHVYDSMTMLLRENAVRANLMRWDDGRGRYVLTGTGRRRISEGSRAPGAVVSFRNRGVVGSGALHRKPADTNLKE